MPSRSVYQGSETILAIAIDIGTTFSGAAYTVMRRGEVPKVYNVKGYKGQENNESNTKVPSVLFYSPTGDLLACGAETKRFRLHQGTRTEWFKLLLRPSTIEIDTPPVNLPLGHDVVDVLSDFLRYMYDCTKSHFIKSQGEDYGRRLWSSLRSTARFVLSHPNGWESYQQDRMREAAVLAELVPDTPEGHDRIEFVTEGEASFHWCIDQSLAESALKPGATVVVADLGGGTIDVSSYTVKTPRPLRLKEQAIADCAVEGSVLVTNRFVESIKFDLDGSPYCDDDYMETLREEFDAETKGLFDGRNQEYTVKIGNRRDNHMAENGMCEISLGYLRVRCDKIAAAFEPSVTALVDAVSKHVGRQTNAHVFLVGGFAASPWVYSETMRRLSAAGIGCDLRRADGETAKAAAHGGVVFYIDRNVTERTMRHTYGVRCRKAYDAENREHRARRSSLWSDPITEHQYVEDAFECLVKKGEVVQVDSVYRTSIQSNSRRLPQIEDWVQIITRYCGHRETVNFSDTDSFAFEDVGSFSCSIPASAMTRRIGQNGAQYYAVNYNVVITLGAVEMKAYVEWEENGVQKRSPAKGVWNDYY